MSDSIPIFEAKNKLPFFVHKAETEGPVHLSRRNKEITVIISASEYKDMENLYIMAIVRLQLEN